VIAGLAQVGEVMALTRNASCVHEKVGPYANVSVNGPAGREVGLVLGGAIDLRVFYSQWAHGFAVEETSDRGTQHSLQFFDAQGTAVHKVFAREQTHMPAWQVLIEQFVATQQAAGLTPQPAPAPIPEKPDAAIDVAAFRQAWADLRDTHEFFGLLKQHGLSRTQALRLAEPRFARQVDAASAQQILTDAAAEGTPIMVFVGNPGMIQIHAGPVRKVAVMGPWVNVLDHGFNLHLREDHIAAAWVVQKPTTDGVVTSLEFFDAQGDTIAMFFGERKPGHAELCAWRELVDRLLGDAQPAGASPCQA
jgi:putative hemin transport protein